MQEKGMFQTILGGVAGLISLAGLLVLLSFFAPPGTPILSDIPKWAIDLLGESKGPSGVTAKGDMRVWFVGIASFIFGTMVRLFCLHRKK